MRIWDVPPGYLNRQSLLGEHRELHGLVSILVNGKKGYSRHPETVRWVGCLAALVHRHDLLVAEMQLRGYEHLSPLDGVTFPLRWPDTFVDEPARQYSILRTKYTSKEPGRLPLPRTARQLWGHHRYSVLARDPALCRAIDRQLARAGRRSPFAALSGELVVALREPPSPGSMARAVERLRRDGEDVMASTLVTDLYLYGGAGCLRACS